VPIKILTTGLRIKREASPGRAVVGQVSSLIVVFSNGLFSNAGRSDSRQHSDGENIQSRLPPQFDCDSLQELRDGM